MTPQLSVREIDRRGETYWITVILREAKVGRVRVFAEDGTELEVDNEGVPLSDGQLHFGVPGHLFPDSEFGISMRFKNAVEIQREVDYYYSNGRINKR